MWIVLWDQFLIKKLLKSEVWGTCVCALFIAKKSKHAAGKKKKRRKETQMWIRKCGSKRILRVCLNRTYFVKTENWKLKILSEKIVFMGLFRYCLLLKIKNIVVK